MNLKKFFLIISTALLISFPAFSDDYTKLQDHMSAFNRQLSQVIPNAAAEQNVYSDAWIGKFIPSLPMHFAIGLESGVTKVDMNDFASAGQMVGIYDIPKSFVYPTIAANAKLGGIFLPFDIGFSCMGLDTKSLGDIGRYMELNYFVIGGSFRWAILQGKGICPVLSIGAGYYYTKGGIGKNNSNCGVNFNYETHTVVCEAQLSKKIVFFTPFIGFRAIFSKSLNSYSWKSQTPIGSFTSGSGKLETKFSESFTPEVFGGIGFTMGFIQLDVNAGYDFYHKIWNGGLSLRFEL